MATPAANHGCWSDLIARLWTIVMPAVQHCLAASWRGLTQQLPTRYLPRAGSPFVWFDFLSPA